MSKKKEIINLMIGYFGTMFGLYGVYSFNKYFLFNLPIWARVVCMFFVYWLIALIPIILMIINKEKLSDYGFSKNNIFSQIIYGLIIGLLLSVFLTLFPHLFGFSDYVSNGNGSYKYIWQFLFEFFYCIISIGMVEEFVFRGFIYTKVKYIFNSDLIAIIISSILFGLFHIFNWSFTQIIITSIFGVILCILRLYLKKVSTLSLVIGHGIYDFLITVLTVVFI